MGRFRLTVFDRPSRPAKLNRSFFDRRPSRSAAFCSLGHTDAPGEICFCMNLGRFEAIREGPRRSTRYYVGRASVRCRFLFHRRCGLDFFCGRSCYKVASAGLRQTPELFSDEGWKVARPVPLASLLGTSCGREARPGQSVFFRPGDWREHALRIATPPPGKFLDEAWAICNYMTRERGGIDPSTKSVVGRAAARWAHPRHWCGGRLPFRW
jgi:hypothetical protein